MQLTTQMNQGVTNSVSSTTVQRTLLRMGLRSRRLVNAPMLTAVHRRRRLKFARQYRNWTTTEWLFLMNHVLCSIGQMDVGVYGVKRLKTNTLKQLLEGSKVEEGALRSGDCFRGILWVYSSLWKARWINTSTYLSLRTISTPTCELFFLRVMASTSRKMRRVIQLAVHVRGSKSTRMSLQYSPGLRTPRT